ncbi:HdeA/HdeB family chaperone [Shewanella sp. 125m-7]
MFLKNLALIALALSIAPIAQADAAKGTKAKDMTCAQFLEVDYETIPVVVGYLYSYNESTGDFDMIEIDALDDVDVDDIIDFCQKNPTAKASAAVKKTK